MRLKDGVATQIVKMMMQGKLQSQNQVEQIIQSQKQKGPSEFSGGFKYYWFEDQQIFQADAEFEGSEEEPNDSSSVDSPGVQFLKEPGIDQGEDLEIA